MPAHYGQECTQAAAHGPQSLVFQEAENRLWAQMAVLADLLGHGPDVSAEVGQVATAPAVQVSSLAEHPTP